MKRIVLGTILSISTLFALDVAIPICPDISPIDSFGFAQKINGVPVKVKIHGIKCFNQIPILKPLNQTLTSADGESF